MNTNFTDKNVFILSILPLFFSTFIEIYKKNFFHNNDITFQIREIGTHGDLMRRKGKYYQLAKEQMLTTE